MCATNTRNEVAFEGSYTAFCSVSLVIVRWNEVEVYVLRLHA